MLTLSLTKKISIPGMYGALMVLRSSLGLVQVRGELSFWGLAIRHVSGTGRSVHLRQADEKSQY